MARERNSSGEMHQRSGRRRGKRNVRVEPSPTVVAPQPSDGIEPISATNLPSDGALQALANLLKAMGSSNN